MKIAKTAIEGRSGDASSRDARCLKLMKRTKKIERIHLVLRLHCSTITHMNELKDTGSAEMNLVLLHVQWA